MTLYWISLPYATFGIESSNDVIVRAAPISYRSIGRKEDDVLEYYKGRGAQVKKVEESMTDIFTGDPSEDMLIYRSKFPPETVGNFDDNTSELLHLYKLLSDSRQEYHATLGKDADVVARFIGLRKAFHALLYVLMNDIKE